MGEDPGFNLMAEGLHLATRLKQRKHLTMRGQALADVIFGVQLLIVILLLVAFCLAIYMASQVKNLSEAWRVLLQPFTMDIGLTEAGAKAQKWYRRIVFVAGVLLVGGLIGSAVFH